MTLNINHFNFPINETDEQIRLDHTISLFCWLQKTHSIINDRYYLRVKGRNTYYKQMELRNICASRHYIAMCDKTISRKR